MWNADGIPLGPPSTSLYIDHVKSSQTLVHPTTYTAGIIINTQPLILKFNNHYKFMSLSFTPKIDKRLDQRKC